MVSLFNLNGLVLYKVRVSDNKFGYFHQQLRIVLKFLKSRRRADILEVLYQILDAELLEFGGLELVAVNEEVDHVLIVHVLHQSVLTEVLQAI